MGAPKSRPPQPAQMAHHTTVLHMKALLKACEAPLMANCAERFDIE